MHLFDIDSDNVHEFINSVGPIRVECYIEFYSKDSDTIKKGTIFRSTYTDRNKKNKRNHIFIIKNEDGSLFMDYASKIYPCLIKHIPGTESKKIQNENNI